MKAAENAMAASNLRRSIGGKARLWLSAFRPKHTDNRDLHTAFNLAYSNTRWTEAGNKSGPGSDPKACAPMCNQLSAFIRAEKIRSIVDVSCGGMAWWPQILEDFGDEISFYGYDVSEVVIRENWSRFKDKPSWQFGVADARTFNYPAADFFLCRQTINHLWREDAVSVVRNISSQARRFMAFTSNPLLKENAKDSKRTPLMAPRREATCYTKMNLDIFPFDLARSVHEIPDVEGEELAIFLSEYPRRHSCCIISAFIGETLARVPQSPAPKDQSFFWANREEFRPAIENSGWTFFHDKGFEGDPSDLAQTSIRSKYFKFLQFLHEGSETPVSAFRFALWADAKRIPESTAAFDAFLSARPKSQRALPGITIRTTPRPKETLDAEIEEATLQERYARTMDRVRIVIREEMDRRGATKKIRICNTGLILFDLANPQVHELNRLIYENTLLTENPECQLFFALYRQRFAELVHVVPYEVHPSVIGAG